MSFFDKTAESFAKYLKSQLSARGVSVRDVTDTEVATWYRTFLSDSLPSEIRLSAVSPDFEEIYTALLTEVTKYESWRDASVSATGSMLLSMIAAGIAYNQTAIIRAAQETSLDTARLPNSIYAMARMLGVRIQRKTPSKVLVTLTNSNTTVEQIIPAYSRWNVGRETYFNRSLVAFRQGEATITEVELFEGEILEEVFESSGLPYQRFEVGIPDFSTSDQDVVCFVNNVEWTRTERGVWSHSGENVFQEDTTAQGSAEIHFGNGEYGNIPPSGAEVRVRIARTIGTLGASASPNLDVTCQVNAAVTGLTTSASVGGGSEKEPNFYRQNAPSLHLSRNKAVTSTEYASIITSYPGVVDAVVRGQQQIDPNDPKYFNKVYVTALREEGKPWTDQEWDDFEVWLEQRSLIGVQLNRQDPKAVVIDVKAKVFCVPNANLKSVRMAIISHLKSTFGIRLGSLGRALYRDDVHKAMRNEPTSRSLVTHVILENPTFDARVDQSGFVLLRNIELEMDYGERKRVS